MRVVRKHSLFHWYSLLFAACVSAFGDTEAPRDLNPVLGWNLVMLRVIEQNPPEPTVASWRLHVVSAAMYEAWAPYDSTAQGLIYGGRWRLPAARRTDDGKAKSISYAAHRALTCLFPFQRGPIDAYLESLGYKSSHTTNVATPEGLGNVCADGVLEFRRKDGSNADRGFIEGTSTNEFTWLNGMVRTHKAPANLLLTHTYDALNRLTRLDYPDGTFETNGYATGSGARLLHRTRHRDRLGLITGWEYDSRERVLRETNTLGHITFYEYCDCGDQPKSIVQASGTAVATTNRFIYDFQGNLRTNILVDGSSLIHKYDAFGILTNTVDAFASTTDTFDNLGRLAAVSNSLGRITSRVYDVEDRVTTATDANGVTITLTYDGLGRLRTRTYPGGAVEGWGYQQDGLNVPTHYTNQVNKVTTYAYDPLGRKTSEIQVGVWTNTFTYTPTGDLLTLSDAKAQVTTWGYNAERQVVSKKYPNGVTNLTYSYFPGGLLSNRWSQAKGSTLYRFNAMGSLTNVIYPSGTTNLTFHYDGLERMTNMVDSVGTTRITYTLGGSQEIVAEDGPWTGANDTVTVTNRLGRSLGVRIAQPAGSWQQTHGYTGGRLSSVASPAGTFTYSYTSAAGAPASASTLIQRILLPTTGGNAYLTNTYDNRGRLLSTQLRNELHAVLNSHAYLLDGLMRTRMTRTDGSYEDYGYDNAGQLRTVIGSAGGTNSFSYGYDAAQNLAARTNGVTVQTFTVNNLNQLTGGPTASYTHDLNGNLTGFGSGNGVYLYDAENQLVTAYVTNNWRSDFLYDGRGRLRTRKEFNWSAGTWSLSTETRYLYEGMRVVQERNGSDLPQVTYTRGSDLSGGREGAGGIGGMLGRSHGYNTGTGAWATHHFYHADGNGNVTYLVNTSRALGASYRYDAYGRTTSTATGTLAPSDNVYRFSSKELHAKSGLYYYGYRFYDPNLQRWPNRDPLGEPGFEVLRGGDPDVFGDGPNLYGFVRNNPASHFDSFGLQDGQTDTDRCKQRCHEWIDALIKSGGGGFNLTKALENCLEGCDRDPKHVPGSPIPPLPTPRLVKPPKQPLWPIIKECAKAAWDWWKDRKKAD